MTNGIIFLDKPTGITSFQVLGSLKKSLGHKKVGHTGTLDKFASGLMIVLSGGFTRLNPYFTGLTKTYRGTFEFGSETDTLDPEGKVIKTGPIPELDAIKGILPQFTGKLLQVPPLYSAVHVDGQRAYKLARAGSEQVLEPRAVEIFTLEILGWAPPRLDLRVFCSKGTYIRSLARDLGQALGTCCYLSDLLREKVGDFTLEHSVSPAKFSTQRDLIAGKDVFQFLPGFSVREADSAWVDAILNGVPFRKEFLTDSMPLSDGLFPVFFEERFLALVEVIQGLPRYRMVQGSEI